MFGSKLNGLASSRDLVFNVDLHNVCVRWSTIGKSVSSTYPILILDHVTVLVLIRVDDGLRSSLNFKCPIPCPADS